MAVLHAIRDFKNSAKRTKPFCRIPKHVRQAFQIYRAFEDGIFQLENRNGKERDLYDRSYLFTDINYSNKSEEEKQEVLKSLMRFLNAMRTDFKITAMNLYQDTESYLDSLFPSVHKEAYPAIREGIDSWKEELKERSSLRGVERTLYLTVTVWAFRPEDARVYFSNLEAQLERLFQSLNSRLIPLNAKERLLVLKRFLKKEEGKQCEDLHLNDIFPVSLEAWKEGMLLGSQYMAVLTAREYDSGLYEDQVFHALSTLPYPSACTLDYAPAGPAVLKEMLAAAHINQERAIAQEMDAKRKRGLLGTGISYTREKQREELEAYQDQVEDNSESGFLLGLLVCVSADSEEELKKRVDAVITLGRENGVRLETYHWVQVKALNTLLPIGCRLVDNLRAFLTSSLVALQPFYAQDLLEPDGILYGLNRTTRHLVIANRKNLASPHGMIVGHTGSGKSFHIKATEISQTLLGTDDDLVCIDPQNELQDACASFGGQFLEISPAGSVRINPMEIPESVFSGKREAKRNQFVADQCAWASAFCESVMKNIVYTQEHRALISRAVRNLYARAFSERGRKKQQTLQDLRKEIETMMKAAADRSEADILRRIYNSLEEHTEGPLALFAQASNLALENRLVVFGLKKVDPSLWETVMVTIMHFLTNRIAYNQEKHRATRIIVEETQVVCAQKASADILLRAVTTYRKFGGICTLVFQNLTRVLENPELRDMLSNCGYKCIFDQGGVDAAALREIQDLSDAEYQSLSRQTPGCCLMIFGETRILLDARMDRRNTVFETFSTNFHEKEEKKEPVREKETLKQEILRLTQVVPVEEEELEELLSSSAGELREVLDELCREGVLEIRTFAGRRQYRSGRKD